MHEIYDESVIKSTGFSKLDDILAYAIAYFYDGLSKLQGALIKDLNLPDVKAANEKKKIELFENQMLIR